MLILFILIDSNILIDRRRLIKIKPQGIKLLAAFSVFELRLKAKHLTNNGKPLTFPLTIKIRSLLPLPLLMLILLRQ